MFSIGPYAYETQLVSPPVFSTFNTEPSTAPFTPPPESVQLTTPSSPEVPFAQLLSSSLDRQRRNSSNNQKFPLSQYEYQPYQQYPGSPGGNLISPGSAISNSGTSSPFPDRHPMLEFRMGEDGAGLGSRLGSGTLTPDGYELGSRLGSGCLTPNGVGVGSGMGSGCLMPDGTGPASRDSFHMENQISEVASLANTESGCHNGGTIIFDHRVSFELTGQKCKLETGCDQQTRRHDKTRRKALGQHVMWKKVHGSNSKPHHHQLDRGAYCSVANCTPIGFCSA
ncbi:hypothetical protein C1H46_014919 [Malus baccata]|uniref:Uncharacterized protein n=1 Tax=Malus baccata TaxID=106549 RepID=A0A540MKX5_MALBA|nr:hypothetical protein C1H46_014919 [Malus baccata]